jgi:hypothetical protein
MLAVAYGPSALAVVDPYEALQAQVPELCADLPFLLQIPKSQVIGENGDLFCIVPLDTDATVAVSAGYWDEENQQYIYDNHQVYPIVHVVLNL